MSKAQLLKTLACRSSAALLVAACTLSGASLDAQTAHLALGANSRGYVSDRLYSGDQEYSAGCATTGFYPSLTSAWDPGSVTLSELAGCSHSGWTGTSVMTSSPGIVKSYTSVTATDPDFLFSGSHVNALIALSRESFLDQLYISPTSAIIPDSIGFFLDLHGTVNSELGPNTTTVPEAEFGVTWNSDLEPGFSEVVMPSGAYYLAFAITSDMIGQSIPFSIYLQSRAAIADIDPSFEMSGSATTDYGNTLSLTKLEFLDATGSGPGEDVTSDVSARFASGATYTSPEPSAVLLVTSGFAVLAMVVRRRARSPGGRATT